MKTLIRIFVIEALILLAIPVAGLEIETPRPQEAAIYRITVPEDNHKVAIVTASFNAIDEEFYMFRGANQLPKRWATFVDDVEIRDENGRPIPFTAMEDGSWQLSTVPQGRVTLSYRLNLDHEDHSWSGGIDGAAYSREWGVFYTARSLFIANGQDRQNITVEFHLPKQWQVTTPWQRRSGETLGFSVPDYDTLSTSVLFAGTHKQVSVEEGQFELLLALGGENVIAQEEEFTDMAKGVLRYYTELMGGIPTLQRQGGVIRSVLIINPGEQSDGEAIGNNISLLLGPSDDQMSQMITRILFAHEFFHLWSGKSFTPNANDTEWFKEGFTNFYTLKALHHIGYLDDESYLGVLANFFYQRYDSDEGVGTLSMTNGDLKHDHWGLIYSGGMFVAIAQDLQIRSASGNQKSLDDLMRLMFDQYSDSGYDIGDIKQELGNLNGLSQEDFFKRYIVGTERIPLSQYLEMADIETEQENSQTVFKIRDEHDKEKSEIQRGLFGR
jgi:predicted metalloprotease with PDZ domain